MMNPMLANILMVTIPCIGKELPLRDGFSFSLKWGFCFGQ